MVDPILCTQYTAITTYFWFFSIQALVVVIILGWLFVPVYIKAGVGFVICIFLNNAFIAWLQQVWSYLSQTHTVSTLHSHMLIWPFTCCLVIRWWPCPNIWRNGLAGSVSVSTSLCFPCVSMCSPKSLWVQNFTQYPVTLLNNTCHPILLLLFTINKLTLL